MKAILKPYLQPAFLVCALVLLTGAASKELVVRFLGLQLVKFPLKLQKPFTEMDEKSILPYVVRNIQKIENPDIIETLGTEDYLQWTLEDPNTESDSPTRFCSLFVTYYTGNPDMVPHVPDECYVGGGNTRQEGTVETAVLRPGHEQAAQEIGYQNILFGSAADSPLAVDVKFYVSYLFRVNGRYSSSRTETRTILGQNFFSKYSYFSKVEWQFYGADAFGRIYPNRQQVVRASEKLLQVVLPALEKEHWPDWEAANRKNNESTGK